MQIFALQTNREKTKTGLLTENERLILTVNYSHFIYILGILPQIGITILLIGVGAFLCLYAGFTIYSIFLGMGIMWLLFAVLPVLYKYIHWFYSFALVTAERIVIVNQRSIVRREVTEVSLENFAKVSAKTQFWNIFPFGILDFTMREENGKPLTLHYVPDAENAAIKIADAVTTFQSKT